MIKELPTWKVQTLLSISHTLGKVGTKGKQKRGVRKEPLFLEVT